MQQFVRFWRQCCLGYSVYCDLDIRVHKCLDGSLSSLDDRLHEGIGGFFEYQRKRDLHAVNAEVIFEHLVVHQAFPVARIAHSRKCVVYEFGVNIHCCVDMFFSIGVR